MRQCLVTGEQTKVSDLSFNIGALCRLASGKLQEPQSRKKSGLTHLFD